MATIPELQYTSVDAIPAIAREVRLTFTSQKTKPLEWRLTQLRKLYWGFVSSSFAFPYVPS